MNLSPRLSPVRLSSYGLFSITIFEDFSNLQPWLLFNAFKNLDFNFLSWMRYCNFSFLGLMFELMALWRISIRLFREILIISRLDNINYLPEYVLSIRNLEFWKL